MSYGKKEGSAPDNGIGMGGPKGIDAKDSVDNKFANSGVPGGESKSGGWIHTEGPHSAKSPAKHGGNSRKG